VETNYKRKSVQPWAALQITEEGKRGDRGKSGEGSHWRDSKHSAQMTLPLKFRPVSENQSSRKIAHKGKKQWGVG